MVLIITIILILIIINVSYNLILAPLISVSGIKECGINLDTASVSTMS